MSRAARKLQADRQQAGAGSQGSLPGASERLEEENSRQAQGEELQAERQKAGARSRGPLLQEPAAEAPCCRLLLLAVRLAAPFAALATWFVLLTEHLPGTGRHNG